MSRFLFRLRDQLLYFWGYKFSILYWSFVIFAAVSHYGANNNLLLAILNGVGFWAVGQLGLLAFIERQVNEKR